ncbi:MAG: UDP-N-acetylglucosamine 2-epimerase (non-hydrolyzing) [Comamonadaceae bacterium]|nr:UDP-N-acetylglucosamine 2-epimerase (non-hydrolyzing) [Comamonadaceae bacterium]RRD57018.1 UDP-N-acetylglucosamine 2-epimerase (non-hydrolyzing) [Comamonadaceae bacterium OH2545_COT-014]
MAHTDTNTSLTPAPGLGPVAAIMGTRPEIIKMAPVVLALRAQGIPTEIIHTGQHDSMAWPLYEFFGLRVDHVLQLQRQTPGLAALSSELLTGIARLLDGMRPRAVLVHGDTTSACMGALAAFYAQRPIGHVEAGLRSGSLAEPFPEEANRSLIGRLARWHFAPTPAAVQNLAGEGITTGVHMVGNTVVDAVQMAARHVRERRSAGHPIDNPDYRWFAASGLPQLVLVTAHRRENWGEPMAGIAQSVASILQAQPQAAVVWPLHPNPAVQAVVQAAHAAASPSVQARWRLSQPADYPQLVELLDAATVILTDSGGIQEEALSLGKPLLVLRDVTERPEVIACGAGRLVGTRPDVIGATVQQLLQDAALREAMRTPHNPFGDGQSARHIAEALAADPDIGLAPSNRPTQQALSPTA